MASGGAYGIDAQAHRSALAAAEPGHWPATVAIMACGLDRYYPAGNEELLRTVASRGLLLSELPPGAAPTRWRFLQRNRLIAALAGTTVVVEARWRSGALNTAHHAAGLGRPVGAVPGSIYSANSAGTHRLLRDGSAVCVTDAAEAAELAGPLDAGAAAEQQAPLSDHDGLSVEDLLLLDALPVRQGTTVEKLSAVAGLPMRAVLAGLGAASGDIVGFMDADLATPLSTLSIALERIRGGADVAIGSREGSGSSRIGEPEYRHVMGRLFNGLVQLLLLPGIHDTQCGFKGFTRAAAHDLFPMQKVTSIVFDVARGSDGIRFNIGSGWAF